MMSIFSGEKRPKNSSKSFSLIKVLFAFAFAVGAAEILARFFITAPLATLTTTQVPIMNEPDPVLGWRAKPGSYSFPRFSPDQGTIKETIWKSRSRATRLAEYHAGPEVWFAGCSFTQGHAVSDDDTFAWKWQSNHSGLNVINLGEAGWGTWQIYLDLKERLRSAKTKPSRIVYFAIDSHLKRNIAHPDFVRLLHAHRPNLTLRIPYCRTQATRVNCYPPTSVPNNGVSGLLSLGALFDSAAIRWTFRNSSMHERPVFRWILSRMSELTQKHAIPLSMVVLQASPENLKFFNDTATEFSIPTTNCAQVKYHPVPVDGHPNAETHTEWANCIDKI